MNRLHLLRFVRIASPRLNRINFAHLFVVSLLPFATVWTARTRLAPAPVAVYAAIFVLVNTAYLVFDGGRASARALARRVIGLHQDLALDRQPIQPSRHAPLGKSACPSAL